MSIRVREQDLIAVIKQKNIGHEAAIAHQTQGWTLYPVWVL